MSGAAQSSSAPSQLGSYAFRGAQAEHTHAYLYPVLDRMLGHVAPGGTIFELGCGNGSTAARLAERGWDITGVDPSPSGIALAREHFPHLKLEPGSSEDDLPGRYGSFDAVLSLEVVEHVYSPQRYAEVVRGLLRPGGVAILSTPYHSYLKNLALAVTGKMDQHFTALWEGGHIKFWSKPTLDTLFTRNGFVPLDFARVGRLPALAKSMVAVYRRNADA